MSACTRACVCCVCIDHDLPLSRVAVGAPMRRVRKGLGGVDRLITACGLIGVKIGQDDEGLLVRVPTLLLLCI